MGGRDANSSLVVEWRHLRRPPEQYEDAVQARPELRSRPGHQVRAGSCSLEVDGSSPQGVGRHTAL